MRIILIYRLIRGLVLELSAIGGIRETQEMLDFCSKHNIGCEIELIPIQKVIEAYERVVNSDVRYRFVIDMKSL
jgi:alcohol dehydrogenase (NADP+)